MANIVIKRSGDREAFSEQKIKDSIRAAAEDAGIAEDDIDEMADQIGNAVIEFFEDADEVHTTEIRDRILSDLDDSNPDVAEAWRNYEKTKVV